MYKAATSTNDDNSQRLDLRNLEGGEIYKLAKEISILAEITLLVKEELCFSCVLPGNHKLTLCRVLVCETLGIIFLGDST